MKEFLESVAKFYDLACWSSATEDYLQIIMKQILSDKTKLLFCWDRSRCTRRMDFVMQDEFFLKDLRKIKRLGYDLNRVLILEDEPRKVYRNYGNAVYVRPFLGQKDDCELLKLASYLQSIEGVEDFRAVDKRGWRAKS